MIDPKKKEQQAAAVASMKETPETKATPEAAKAPSQPPLPRVPKSPRRPAVAAREAAAQAAALPPQPPPKGRELPEDPVAREAALAEVRPVAEVILALCDVLASRLPPARPLSPGERLAIKAPLELTLYKYDADLEPEWQLLAAVGAVIGMRYVEVKMAPATSPPNGKEPAGKATVEIQKAT